MKQHPDVILMKDDLNSDPEGHETILAAASAQIRNGYYGSAYHLLTSSLVKLGGKIPSPEFAEAFAATMMLLASTVGDDAYVNGAGEFLGDALYLWPKDRLILTACAQHALQIGNYDRAGEAAQTVLATYPGDKSAWHALAMSLFYARRWGEAWDAFENTRGTNQRPDNIYYPHLPYWDGKDTKHLLVIGEQGLGEEIMLSSMLADLVGSGLCENISLICDERLGDLFLRSFGPVIQIIPIRGKKIVPNVTIDGVAMREFVDDFSARCLASSLGRYLRREEKDFNGHDHLFVDEPFRHGDLAGPTVGIAWSGGKPPSYSYRRGLNKDEVLQLTDIPGVTWVSLQYEENEDQLNDLRAAGRTIASRPFITDGHNMLELARFVMGLDAVVTVTTTMAHLCGAIDRRAHVLVPRIPRWQYGLEGPNPWYGCLVQHRQGEAWPIEEVKAELRKELGL